MKNETWNTFNPSELKKQSFQRIIHREEQEEEEEEEKEEVEKEGLITAIHTLHPSISPLS
jgi:hypothetical protein